MLPPDSVLLDTARPGPDDTAGALLFTRPHRTLRASRYDEVGEVLAALDREAAAGRWCAGFLAYEAAYALDRAAFPDPPALDCPLAWFGVYDAPERLTPEAVEAMLADAGPHRTTEPQFALDLPAYRARIGRIRHLIREGDVYQVNLTAPMTFGFEGDPLGLYAALRRKQRVAYGAVVRAGAGWTLSLSPELLVRRDGDRFTARPMKGTARRAPTAEADAARALWLVADEKNRAENLMIVDLLRNDLSVVARPGSVRVPRLFEAERYETLWQMTSTVTAEARPGVGVADALRALFPCGSVTGAPKRRAMRRIRELEDAPRGVYCGAIGVVKPGGDFVFSVPIRTVELLGDPPTAGRMGIGSGVVWDSDADEEYAECLLKARFLTGPARPDFRPLETMRAERGRIPLLDRHLARLSRSARYFEFVLDEATVRARMEETLRGVGEGPHRVRLTLGRGGDVAIEAEPADDTALRLHRAVVFPEPAPSDDPFLRHKTTHRPFYDRALAWARARGADEAILLNERGEVTEGTFTNLWVRRGDRLLTPPLASGGLGGVYREHLLATRPDAAEAVLRPDDLRAADAVLLSNAVRGLQEVRVGADP